MPSPKLVVLPYRLGSKSAKSLADSFARKAGRKVFQVAENSKTFRPKAGQYILNWGLGRAPAFAAGGRVLNPFEAVARSSNKLSTFRQLSNSVGISIPEFTTDRQVAQNWFNDGQIVVCRTVLNGHSGVGIIIRSHERGIEDLPLPAAPLYVKYVKKTKEYRVHGAFGRVIDVQEKRKRQEVPTEQVNFQVRNHANGWNFCRENVVKPAGLDNLALAGIAKLGLDFGAADIIYNERSGILYLLEVNTAPGLEGATVQSYADAIWNRVTGR